MFENTSCSRFLETPFPGSTLFRFSDSAGRFRSILSRFRLSNAFVDCRTKAISCFLSSPFINILISDSSLLCDLDPSFSSSRFDPCIIKCSELMSIDDAVLPLSSSSDWIMFSQDIEYSDAKRFLMLDLKEPRTLERQILGLRISYFLCPRGWNGEYWMRCHDAGGGKFSDPPCQPSA